MCVCVTLYYILQINIVYNNDCGWHVCVRSRYEHFTCRFWCHLVYVWFEWQKLKIQLGNHFCHNQHEKVPQETLDTNFYSQMLLRFLIWQFWEKWPNLSQKWIQIWFHKSYGPCEAIFWVVFDLTWLWTISDTL